MQVSAQPQPPSRFADLPDALEALILRSLEKSPDQRYQQAAEMAAALRQVAPTHVQVVLQRREVPLPLPLGEQVTAAGLAYETTTEVARDLFNDSQAGQGLFETGPTAVAMRPGAEPQGEALGEEATQLPAARPQEDTALPTAETRIFVMPPMPRERRRSRARISLRTGLLIGAISGLILGTLAAYLTASEAPAPAGIPRLR